MFVFRSFAKRLIEWQRRRGRHDLPWQGTRDPYRIWIAEVMLQQTQVATVIPYYRRFISRFPDAGALARAELDEVLAAWSGLGYYSRARHLHRAARRIADLYGGRFPRAREALEALPGIGRSTAAAVAVFSAGAREPILDGNAKRVLARHFAVSGYPGERRVERKLWALAESLLPEKGIERYTQALMDLGATVCVRARPACESCPVAASCEARSRDRVSDFPAPRPRKIVPRRHAVMPILLSESDVLLVKRPPAGVWGGLWSLPEFGSMRQALSECPLRFGCEIESHRRLAPLEHGFSHYDLTITPLVCRARRVASRAQQPGSIWLEVGEALGASIPAPVRTLLRMVRDEWGQE